MAQLVVGSPGKDTLTGGDLDDTLVAASGRMTMTGGDGADTFVFNLDDITGRHNTAVITDFDPNADKLQISNANDVRKSSDHHGGTLLQVGNETIDLLGVKPNELHHHDWIASGRTTPTASSLANQSFALLNQHLAGNSGRADPGQIVAAASNGATGSQDSS